MNIPYKPLSERIPDSQYADRLNKILHSQDCAKSTPQGVGALTLFGRLSPMIFDIANGVPLITERKLGSWKMAVGEIIAFINGARSIDDIESYGCGPRFWGSYRGKGTELGLEPNDMGPGSYGAVFHDYERADGTTLNQFEQLVDQIRKYPTMRTHKVTNWRPDYTARGTNRKVIVAPCHGDIHVRVLGDRLDMVMHQRSGDFPVGVPHNMIQYAALFLMICQVTGYRPGYYCHDLTGDIHIYENQIEAARELIMREARPFPILRLDSTVGDLFAFRVEHFTLDEYNPHPAMNIPFSP